MKRLLLALVLIGSLTYSTPAHAVGACDSNTVFLTHADGASGAVTSVDQNCSGGGAKTITWTNQSAVTILNPKYGQSILFDGTDDSIQVADSADFNFAAGDFAIEMWVWYNTVTDHSFFIQAVDSSNFVMLRTTGATMQFIAKTAGTAQANYTYTPSFSSGQWYHIEASRNGTTFRIFQNGVSQTLTANTAISTNTLPDLAAVIKFGADSSTAGGGTEELNGQLEEIVVTKGNARDTANFTPSGPYGQVNYLYSSVMSAT